VAIPPSGSTLPDNGPVNARLARIAGGVVTAAYGAAAVSGIGGLSACASGPPAKSPGSAAPTSDAALPGAAVTPRAELSRRVAAAKDRPFSAAYSWTGGGAERTVTVTVAPDRTWRVDVPGGALGGNAPVTLVGRADGVYQCAGSGCVRVARAASSVPSAVDPKVHHPFTDWPLVLTDRGAAISVATAQMLPGATGACFSVEPATVSLAGPIESGIFCYDDSGLPTGFKGAFGTLVLAGPPAPAPATAALPEPLVGGPPLGTAAPRVAGSVSPSR
jgi:hypothetical protein